MQSERPWYISSSGHGLSLTLKGLALGVVPTIVVLLSMAGVSVVENDLVELVETAAAIVSGIVVLVGLGRKIYYTATAKR